MATATSRPYDAIVVGGGHNGLVCAAYLARAGQHVLVLERRHLVGGAAVSEELFPGYKVSTASYLVSLMQEKIIRDLDLPRHGYHVFPKDPSYFALQPNGRHFFMWRDMARTQAEIARLSARDAERYPRYEAMLDRIAGFVRPLLLQPPPGVPPRTADDFVQLLKLGKRVLRLSRQDLATLVRFFTASVAELLDDWFESEELKVALAADGVIGVSAGPRSPGTAYVLLHHQMGGVDGSRGLWGFARGGMGAISNAIAAAAREAGAEIRTDAAVSRVLVRDGSARGVELTTGERLLATGVISNLDPRQTFLNLVGAQHLPRDLVAEVERYRCTGASFKLNLALGERPSYSVVPGTALGPQHMGTTHIAPSMDYLERAWDDAKYGRPSAHPMLEIGLPTSYDDSIAPPGNQIMSIFAQYAPYHLAEGSWDQMRDAFVDRLVDTLAEHAPNVRSAIEHRFAMAPPDIEERFGMTGGHIFHGELSFQQLFWMRPFGSAGRYSTPVRNLYLCGSGTHPGGGVMGAPGHNAAQAILRETR
ncbi:MAG: NAD(P)/FAD-dependent oxidoreductase [Chloroflexota bacterium]